MARTVAKVHGLQDLKKRMEALSSDVAKKIAFSATLAAANVIKKQAIRNAAAMASKAPHMVYPDQKSGRNGVLATPGNLSRNVIVKRRSAAKQTANYVVTARSGEKAAYAYMYGLFLEEGTVKMSPKPWLRPAFESAKQDAANQMIKVLERRIMRAEK